MTAIRKHSVTIAGHPTSISLEEPFWLAVKALARRNNRTLAAEIAEIDRTRGDHGLSSAIRLAVLADLERRLMTREEPDQSFQG